jgi:hypothetical protein
MQRTYPPASFSVHFESVIGGFSLQARYDRRASMGKVLA